MLAANTDASYGSTLTLHYSYNLTNWTPVTQSFQGSLFNAGGGGNRVKYLNGTFFAVGFNNTTLSPIRRSTNGIDWVPPTSFPNVGEPFGIIDIQYANGLYLAVGASGFGGNVYRSTDGQTWVESQSSGGPDGNGGFGTTNTGYYPSPNSGGFISGLAYGNGVWVVVGHGVTSLGSVYFGVYRSVNGINFTYSNNNALTSSNNGPQLIAFDGGKFVLTGNDNSFRWRWSTDGSTWFSTNFTGDLSWTSIYLGDMLYNGTMWLACGGNEVKYSSNGFAWTNVPAGGLATGNYQYLSWSGSRWFAGLGSSAFSFAYSYNGIVWTSVLVPSVNQTFNGNFGISVYASELINILGDAITTQDAIIVGDTFNYNAFTTNTIDYTGIVSSFVPFSNPTSIPFGSNNYTGGVPAISGNGQVQLIIGLSTLWRSVDYGSSWAATDTFTNIKPKIPAVSATGKLITVPTQTFVGGSNYIYTSYNYGSNWTQGSFTRLWSDSSAMNASGQYQIVGTDNEYFYTSSNFGATWTAVTTFGSFLWGGAAISASGQYQAICAYAGQIYMSSDYGATWTVRTNVSNYLFGTIGMSGSGSYLVAASANQTVLKSSDYGNTWTKTVQGLDSRIAMSYTGQYVLGRGTYNAIISTDYGNTFAATNAFVPQLGPSPDLRFAMSATAQYMIVLGSDESFTYSTRAILPTSFRGGLTANMNVNPYATLGNGSQSNITSNDNGRTFLLNMTNNTSSILWLPSTFTLPQGWHCTVLNFNSNATSQGTIFVSTSRGSLLAPGNGGAASSNPIGLDGSAGRFNSSGRFIWDGSNFYVTKQ
jgi:hypothetical protein